MVAVPDSGVFINFASPETGNYKVDNGMKTLFKVSNVDEKRLNPVCNRFKKDEEYIMLLFSIDDNRTPFFGLLTLP